MYSAPFYHAPFRPDPSAMQYAEEREAFTKRLREETSSEPPVLVSSPPALASLPEEGPPDLKRLLEMVSPEDSALIALILFLLCDNSENDVVLLGILLYVLLSK